MKARGMICGRFVSEQKKTMLSQFRHPKTHLSMQCQLCSWSSETACDEKCFWHGYRSQCSWHREAKASKNKFNKAAKVTEEQSSKEIWIDPIKNRNLHNTNIRVGVSLKSSKEEAKQISHNDCSICNSNAGEVTCIQYQPIFIYAFMQRAENSHRSQITSQKYVANAAAEGQDDTAQGCELDHKYRNDSTSH